MEQTLKIGRNALTAFLASDNVVGCFSISEAKLAPLQF
jgi:hypothetical protein